MMTNSNKLLNNTINSEMSQMSLKRNLMQISTNQLNESHLRSLDSEDMNINEDMIDSEKDDTNDDSETDSGSASDGEESSGLQSFFRLIVFWLKFLDIYSIDIDIDEEECDRRKDEYMIEMSDLEKQFLALKDQLYVERLSQVEHKLEEVRAGRAQEYLQPLEELQENMRIRTEVAGILSQLKITNIKCQYEAEMLANKQNFEVRPPFIPIHLSIDFDFCVIQSEKQLLKESIRQDVEEKLRRLEEDRNSIDSDIWSESAFSKKKKRYGSAGAGTYDSVSRDPINSLDRRRKPVTVSGPYIVYMLKDTDIMDDWNVIRRALKSVSTSYL